VLSAACRVGCSGGQLCNCAACESQLLDITVVLIGCDGRLITLVCKFWQTTVAGSLADVNNNVYVHSAHACLLGLSVARSTPQCHKRGALQPRDALMQHHFVCNVCCLAAALLGVDKAGLEHALTTRSRVMREGVIVSPLNVRAALDNR